MKRFIQQKAAFTLAEVFSPHSKGQRKIAFTLAEVLITLGIIGVVAAITMPTLIQNYKKTVYVNQLKKSVSTLEQGFQKMMADDGVDRLTDTSIWPQVDSESGETCFTYQYNEEGVCKKFFEDLKNYFNYTEISPAASTDDGYVQKFLNENDGDHIGTDSYMKFPDGMWVYGGAENSVGDYDDYVGFVTIDINGIKGPNMYGRDVFVLNILNNGKLKDNASAEDCDRTGQTGYGCYNRIIEDGWKMDY